MVEVDQETEIEGRATCPRQTLPERLDQGGRTRKTGQTARQEQERKTRMIKKDYQMNMPISWGVTWAYFGLMPWYGVT